MAGNAAAASYQRVRFESEEAGPFNTQTQVTFKIPPGKYDLSRSRLEFDIITENNVYSVPSDSVINTFEVTTDGAGYPAGADFPITFIPAPGDTPTRSAVGTATSDGTGDITEADIVITDAGEGYSIAPTFEVPGPAGVTAICVGTTTITSQFPATPTGTITYPVSAIDVLSNQLLNSFGGGLATPVGDFPLGEDGFYPTQLIDRALIESDRTGIIQQIEENTITSGAMKQLTFDSRMLARKTITSNAFGHQTQYGPPSNMFRSLSNKYADGTFPIPVSRFQIMLSDIFPLCQAETFDSSSLGNMSFQTLINPSVLELAGHSLLPSGWRRVENTSDIDLYSVFAGAYLNAFYSVSTRPQANLAGTGPGDVTWANTNPILNRFQLGVINPRLIIPNAWFNGFGFPKNTGPGGTTSNLSEFQRKYLTNLSGLRVGAKAILSGFFFAKNNNAAKPFLSEPYAVCLRVADIRTSADNVIIEFFQGRNYDRTFTRQTFDDVQSQALLDMLSGQLCFEDITGNSMIPFSCFNPTAVATNIGTATGTAGQTITVPSVYLSEHYCSLEEVPYFIGQHCQYVGMLWTYNGTNVGAAGAMVNTIASPTNYQQRILDDGVDERCLKYLDRNAQSFISQRVFQVSISDIVFDQGVVLITFSQPITYAVDNTKFDRTGLAAGTLVSGTFINSFLIPVTGPPITYSIRSARVNMERIPPSIPCPLRFTYQHPYVKRFTTPLASQIRLPYVAHPRVISSFVIVSMFDNLPFAPLFSSYRVSINNAWFSNSKLPIVASAACAEHRALMEDALRNARKTFGNYSLTSAPNSNIGTTASRSIDSHISLEEIALNTSPAAPLLSDNMLPIFGFPNTPESPLRPGPFEVQLELDFNLNVTLPPGVLPSTITITVLELCADTLELAA
jgi:hypothetical protein